MDFLSNFLSSTFANLASLFLSKNEKGGKNIRIKTKNSQNSGEVDSGITFGGIHQTTNNTTLIGDTGEKTSYRFRDMSNTDIKNIVRVLFVDDQDQISTIKNLRKLGWRNAEQLLGDAVNTDAESYRIADIVFVDFDNIGPLRNGQGLSILSSLVAKYGRKKFYILHTAHPKKITLQKLEESGLPIRDAVGWYELIKGSPDYLLETTMLTGLRQVER